MSETLQEFTQEEVIDGLRAALAFYADTDSRWTEDLCLNDFSDNYLKPGQRARDAIDTYQSSTRTLRSLQTNVNCNNVQIVQNANKPKLFVVVVDGVEQKRVRSVEFQVSVDESAYVKIEQIV